MLYLCFSIIIAFIFRGIVLNHIEKKNMSRYKTAADVKDNLTKSREKSFLQENQIVIKKIVVFVCLAAFIGAAGCGIYRIKVLNANNQRKLACIKTESAIKKLPTEIKAFSEDNDRKINNAMKTFNDAKEKGVHKKDIKNLSILLNDYKKISNLKKIRLKIINNINKEIIKLPQPDKVVLEDKNNILNVRTMINNAKNNGIHENEISNISKLNTLEYAISKTEIYNKTKQKVISEAESDINSLMPVDKITLDKREKLRKAEVSVEKAKATGIKDTDIKNLALLRQAEDKMKKLEADEKTIALKNTEKQQQEAKEKAAREKLAKEKAAKEKAAKAEAAREKAAKDKKAKEKAAKLKAAREKTMKGKGAKEKAAKVKAAKEKAAKEKAAKVKAAKEKAAKVKAAEEKAAKEKAAKVKAAKEKAAKEKAAKEKAAKDKAAKESAAKEKAAKAKAAREKAAKDNAAVIKIDYNMTDQAILISNTSCFIDKDGLKLKGVFENINEKNIVILAQVYDSVGQPIEAEHINLCSKKGKFQIPLKYSKYKASKLDILAFSNESGNPTPKLYGVGSVFNSDTRQIVTTAEFQFSTSLTYNVVGMEVNVYDNKGKAVKIKKDFTERPYSSATAITQLQFILNQNDIVGTSPIENISSVVIKIYEYNYNSQKVLRDVEFTNKIMMSK